jgi:sugar/nucleoside kinase (ribokinase family)
MRFTVIGHLTRDLLPTGGFGLGGTASYAAVMAQRLGAHTTIITRAHPDEAAHPHLAGVEIVNLGSDCTTTFENIYHDGNRTQFIRATAPPLLAGDIAEPHTTGDVFLLGPLCQEVDPALAARLHGLKGVVPQGWLRAWDDEGRVHAIPWRDADRILPHIDVIVASEADLTADPKAVNTLIERVAVTIITVGPRGCILWLNGVRHDIPPRPAVEIDPTGAGDIFTAAFLIRLWETGDPIASAYFANVAASFSVEGEGLAAIPDRASVETFIRAFPLVL